MGWVLFILALFLIGCSTEPIISDPQENTEGDVKMKISSPNFNEGEMIPSKYTCDGEDINPEIVFEDIPGGAKSLALIYDDPDAPVGTWTHWLIKNIPPETKGIMEKSTIGEEVDNSFGKVSHGGPCPPSGVHRYFFKLYALDVEKMDAATISDFYKEVEEHKIEEASLMGKYSRS